MASGKLVALETSWSTGSVALFDHGAEVAGQSIGEGMRHGRDLVPVLGHLVREAGWRPAEIAAVAVSIGPGSFTGLRIAVTVARMLAWQNGAAMLAVPTLQSIALRAVPLAEKGGNSEIAVVSDALRGGVYAARFALPAEAGGVPEYMAGETVGPAEEIAEALPPDCLITGDGLKRFGALFGGWVHVPADLWQADASTVGRLGCWMLDRGRQIEAAKLEPLYVRRPSPEEVWQRRQRGGR